MTSLEWIKKVSICGCFNAHKDFDIDMNCEECPLLDICSTCVAKDNLSQSQQAANIYLEKHNIKNTIAKTEKSSIEQQMLELGLDMIRLKRKPSGETYWLVQGDSFPSHFIGNSIQEAIDKFKKETNKGEMA